MKIEKAENMITTSYLPKFLIIGESGGGKTTALRTFPPSWRVLVLDIFGNKESLEGAPNVDVATYSDLDPKVPTSWALLEKDRREIIKAIQGGKFPYKVIVVDTLTGLIRMAENYILATNPDHKGIAGAPGELHYRGLAHVAAEFIQSIISLPLITVINCHVEFYEGREGEVSRYQIIMSGKRMRSTIYSYLGEVYRSFGTPKKDGNGTSFKWQTQPDSSWPMLKSVLNQGQKYFGKFIKPNYEELLKARGMIE